LIVSLDADFLGELPGHVRYARDFARTRVPQHAMSRLYVAECMPSVTGAAADHRAAARSSDVGGYAVEIAQRLRKGAATGADSWIDAVVADLGAHAGKSVVVVGDTQPSAVHAIGHWINARLGNVGATVDFIEPIHDVATTDGASLADLV